MQKYNFFMKYNLLTLCFYVEFMEKYHYLDGMGGDERLKEKLGWRNQDKDVEEGNNK
jgi:hypothetical protein